MKLLLPVTALVLATLSLTSCGALFDTGREELVATIVAYEAECEALVQITDQIDPLERALDELRSGLRQDQSTLRGVQGCGPCADRLSALAGESLADRPVASMTIKPVFGTPTQASDRRSDLEARLLSLETSRDGLRARAEERGRLERDVEALLAARGALDEPVCAEARCGEQLEPSE